MYDFIRVAGLATFALGAAGASGQITHAAPLETAALLVETVPLAPPPATLPMAELPTTRTLPPAIEETAPLRDGSTTLAELVRNHTTSDSASREQECLAIATYFESKGEPLDGQLAVARVVLNRAASGRFASSVCGVVTQRGQFSFVRGGAMPSVPRNSVNWRTAVAIAHIASNDMWTPSAQNALYFHARRVSPGWRMTRVAAIGNHVFYR